MVVSWKKSTTVLFTTDFFTKEGILGISMEEVKKKKKKSCRFYNIV